MTDRSESRTALLLRAELLAKHFGGNSKILEALVEEGRPTEGELLALAMGWSGAPAARDRFEAARETGMRMSLDVSVRINLMIAPGDKALDALRTWLRYGEGEGWLMAPPTTAALKRTAGDPKFAEALSAWARQERSASEVATGARLLAAAGRLDEELRSYLEERLAHAVSGPNTDAIALDIIAEGLRPLGWSLWDALRGSTTTDLG